MSSSLRLKPRRPQLALARLELAARWAAEATTPLTRAWKLLPPSTLRLKPCRPQLALARSVLAA